MTYTGQKLSAFAGNLLKLDPRWPLGIAVSLFWAAMLVQHGAPLAGEIHSQKFGRILVQVLPHCISDVVHAKNALCMDRSDVF